PIFVFWKISEKRITSTATEAMIANFIGEKTKVLVPIEKPVFESGGLITASCPPQYMVMRAFTIPSKPRVAIIGATLAIGPELVCLSRTLIKAISINALIAAPANIAQMSAIQ
ncbi:MAG: hypothetical protein RL237_807, partial [Actinomycetota bacterium]